MAERDRKNNHREVGAAYERQAVSYLEEKGYRIITKNYACRMGEIDIIAWSPPKKHEKYLVFVEVKFRRNVKNGVPEMAVDVRKQKKIIRTAEHYLYGRHFSKLPPCRFDVIAIEENHIRHIMDAFQTE